MSTYATPLSPGKTSPKGFLRVLGKMFTGSGVIESTALTVSAQLTPDMTVKVSGSALNDNAILIHSDGTFIQAWNESDANVTIAANASGVTKTDAIVAYVDLTAGLAGTEDVANNPGSFKFKAVRRGGSDTGAPTSGEIATNVANNPYIVLAYVTVANGATSINSGNISDQRPRAQLETDRLELISASQIATLPVKRQNDTTNSDTSVKILTGWGQIVGDNTTQLSESVTFGVTFSSAPVVIMSPIGVKATTAATSITQFSNPGNQKNIAAGTIGISTTGFTASLTVGGTLAETNQRLAGGFYWGYSWIAIGEVA